MWLSAWRPHYKSIIKKLFRGLFDIAVMLEWRKEYIRADRKAALRQHRLEMERQRFWGLVGEDK